MFIRMFLRVMFNNICNNAVTRFVCFFVNFCKNISGNNKNFLKFSQNVPLYKLDTNNPLSFRSVTGDEIDCKNVKTC